MPPIEIEILPKGLHKSSNGYLLKATDQELDEVVSSYDPTRFKAPLIISHDTKGIPDAELHNKEFAFGVPKALKRAGDTIKAVFDKVAPEFEGWVRDRKLLAVSPSFYLPDSPHNPTPGKLALRHIAALGATAPAIKGTQSLQEAFNFSDSEEGIVNFAFAINPGTLEFCGSVQVQAQLWQSLRDWLIQENSIEIADKIIPAYLVGMLQQDSNLAAVAYSEPEKPMTTTTTPDDGKSIGFAERERLLKKREQDLLRREFVSFCETDLKGKLTPAIAPTSEVVEFMVWLAGTDSTVDFAEGQPKSPVTWFQDLLKKLPQSVPMGRVIDNDNQDFSEKPKGDPDREAKEAYENAYKH